MSSPIIFISVGTSGLTAQLQCNFCIGFVNPNVIILFHICIDMRVSEHSLTSHSTHNGSLRLDLFSS